MITEQFAKDYLRLWNRAREESITIQIVSKCEWISCSVDYKTSYSSWGIPSWGGITHENNSS